MAQKVKGSGGQAAKELVNPRKNKWRVRWDMKENEDGTAEWVEQDFDYEPTETEILRTLVAFYNKQVDEEILSGYRWHDMPVWLSTENQFNYKASYDLAVQTDGANLPVRVKFGTDDEPIYHDFTSVEELADFYKGAMAFINKTLQEGWAKKDSIFLNKMKYE